MGLFHRKINSGRLVSHAGVRFRFEPTPSTSPLWISHRS
jgi:hypothetical protein